jgi:glycosyltransferase involved in cell wall biosynthesis
MNVIVLAPFDLRVRDGTSIRVTNMTKATSEISEAIYIISNSINEELKELNNLKHIRIKSIQARYHFIMAFTKRLFKKTSHLIADKIFEKDLMTLKYIFKNIDIIHVHWLINSYIAKILRDELEISNTPTIIDLHGLYRLQPLPKYSMKASLAHFLGFIYESLAIKDKDLNGFIVPSNGLKTFLSKSFGIEPNKIFIVPDAVDPVIIETAKKCDEVEEDLKKFLEKYPVLDDAIAYVGTISMFHGFLDLLKAVRIIRKISDKNIKLFLIIPSKSQLKEFHSLLPKDTIVLENIPRKYIPCILRRTSVLILPHKAGTQFDYIPSNKIYDYMLAGRPIVAYRTPATTETLKTYPMKILVKPNDVYALAEGIIRALELWRNIEPRPIFSNMPTLEEVKRSLDLAYKYFYVSCNLK